jgi:hypothetical protein
MLLFQLEMVMMTDNEEEEIKVCINSQEYVCMKFRWWHLKFQRWINHRNINSQESFGSR